MTTPGRKEQFLQQFNAVQLYRGNQLDGDKHLTVYNFFQELNNMQRKQYLVAEHDDGNITLHLFMPKNHYEISIIYRETNSTIVTRYLSRHNLIPKIFMREEPLTVNDLNTAVKMIVSQEVDCLPVNLSRLCDLTK